MLFDRLCSISYNRRLPDYRGSRELMTDEVAAAKVATETVRLYSPLETFCQP